MVNAAGLTVQLADAFAVGPLSSLQTFQGTFDSAGFDITASVYFGGTADVDLGASILTSGSEAHFTSTGVFTTAGANLVLPNLTHVLNFAVAVSFARLISAIPSQVVTWYAGAAALTVLAYVPGDWGGAAGNLVRSVSATPGTQWFIVAPAGVVVQYMFPQDSNNAGPDIDADDYTSMDGGNNNGWLFAPMGASGYYKYW
jgi:hypothetical protein